MPITRRVPIRLLLFATGAAAVVLGCNRGGGEPPGGQRQGRPAVTLSIGLIPEQNIFRQRERYGPLARYVGDRTGVGITLKTLTRYGNIVDNFERTGLDGAFFGSFTYALAHRRIGVEAIARPEWQDGRSTYHGLIFARRGLGIRSAADLRGRRFAFVDRATTAGYLLPLEYLAHAGVKDPSRFFGESYFAGTHEDAIHDVVNGKADAGAAKNTVYQRLLREEPAIADALDVLHRSPEVPENALALRREIDPALRDRIAAVLLSMHDDPEGQVILQQFGARRFIATSDADYEPVYRYAAEVGLDLTAYQYDNH